MKTYILAAGLSLLFLATTAFSQQKTVVAASANVPVSYGVVVDNSGSARASLDKIVNAVKEIVEANGETDETFLVRFSSADKIRLIEEFTKDKNVIREAANDLYTESGQTAIIDAVEFSAKYLSENANKDAGRKKVLILITDGEERGSQIKIEEALKSLKEKGITVYSIGISDEIVVKKVLDKLANGTGGKLFLPKNQLELSTATSELTKIIRVQ